MPASERTVKGTVSDEEVGGKAPLVAVELGGQPKSI